ncbi:MAG: Eco57I restriction-modification methylase domain-containing protein, partial [Candidatus Aenigmatarchaeota archaeon]
MQFDELALHEEIRSYIRPLLLMTGQYPAVAANPPYLGSRKMNKPLKSYLKKHYPRADKNLFAVFIELMLDGLVHRGRLGIVTLESWMFLSSFKEFRYHLLESYQIQGLVHLGWGILGIEFGTATAIFENAIPDENTSAEYSRLEEKELNPETRVPYTFPVKDNDRYAIKAQKDFERLPGAPIAYWVSDRFVEICDHYPALGAELDTREGMTTADNSRFLRMWPEVNRERLKLNTSSHAEAKNSHAKWFPYEKGGSGIRWYGNHTFVVDWENDGEAIKNNVDPSTGRVKSHNYNGEYAFREGIAWTSVSSGDIAVRYSPPGFLFDTNGPKGFVEGEPYFQIALINSKVSLYALKAFSPTMDYKLGHVESIPLKKDEKKDNIDSLSEECISLAKKDWDSRETSWDFARHPLGLCPYFCVKALARWKK